MVTLSHKIEVDFLSPLKTYCPQKRPNRNPVGLFCVCIVMRIGDSAKRSVFVSTKDGRRHCASPFSSYCWKRKSL